MSLNVPGLRFLLPRRKITCPPKKGTIFWKENFTFQPFIFRNIILMGGVPNSDFSRPEHHRSRLLWKQMRHAGPQCFKDTTWGCRWTWPRGKPTSFGKRIKSIALQPVGCTPNGSTNDWLALFIGSYLAILGVVTVVIPNVHVRNRL